MSDTPDTSTNLSEVLHWYYDSGVDVALSDESPDRFVETSASVSSLSSTSVSSSATASILTPTPTPTPTSSPASTSTSSEPTVPSSVVIGDARDLASGATDLESLRSAIESFEGCNLKQTANTTVFSDGEPTSDLMIIGEAPGREEDERGLPFVGRSGRLLDKILATIDRDRTNTYITNVIPWRPPGNRTPTPMETEICRPFIERHIELIDPSVILLLGNPATKTLLNTKTGILSLRGRWHEIELSEKKYRALPSLHPAYLLRQPLQKRLVWRDFLSVRSALEG